MIELDAHRMNFLRQGRASFTYRTMKQLAIAWCLLLAAVYGVGLLRAVAARHGVAKHRERLEALNAEKDRQIQTLEAAGRERIGASAKEDLTAILTHRPIWSEVLKRLTRSMPAQLWFSSLKVQVEKGGGYSLEVSGYAKSQRALTTFVLQLESGGFFRDTELGESRKVEGEGELFQYDITTRPVFSKFGGRPGGRAR